MRQNVKIAAVAFVSGVATMIALDWIKSPSTFEACFVREARGLSDKAVGIAYELCKSRFPKPLLNDAVVFGN